MKKLTVATCQFPIDPDIKKNLKYIRQQIKYAHSKNSDIVHFSECCLSGYAGYEFQSFDKVQAEELNSSLTKIRKMASEMKIWVIIGSHHHESGGIKPFNSLYVINSNGEIIVRYDKRFLTGKQDELDHKYYTPGVKPVTFNINGIRCGLLICHEWRYPELYREYKALGTKIIFQSWYDAYLTKIKYLFEGKELGELIVGTVKGNAANNYFWISASNTSKKESNFSSFLVQPDGHIVNSLRRNRARVLINIIDFDEPFIDPSAYGRAKIMNES